MANGILNLAGAVGLLGLVLAVALIILWFTIRIASSSDRADGHKPCREEQVAAEVLNGEVSTLTDDDRALEAKVSEALEPSRS